MNDTSEKSEINSVETRISAHTFFQNSGDGPQAFYANSDSNQMSLHELSSVDKNIMLHNIDLSNTTDSIGGSTVTNVMPKTNIQATFGQGKHRVVPVEPVATKSDIREIFKHIQYSMNQLKVINSSIKNQISKDSEEIGSYLLDREYSQQILSKADIANIVNSTELQRLQMSLLYILEQMTHLSGTISTTQMQIDKLNGQKRVDDKENKEIGIDKICQEEDDIFSVEELSWDENHVKQDRKTIATDEKSAIDPQRSLDKQVQVRISQPFFKSTISPFIIAGSDEINNNELSNDDSIKAQHSKSFTQQSNNNDYPHSEHDKIELTNSFHDIKKRFENINYTHVTTQSQKKDVFLTPNKDDKRVNVKDSVEISQKSRTSFVDNDFFLNKQQELNEDCVDNSAFLVSSIDSFTNSISCTNPDNNNNKFSEKFKTIEANTIEKNKISSSIDIDVMADMLTPKNHSNKSISTKSDGAHLKRLLKNINFKNMEQYIEVEHGGLMPNVDFVQSPYSNYHQKNDVDTKSSTSSSEKIVAFGKLYGRLKKSVKEDKAKHDEFSPLYCYMKELIDSEKSYVTGLFILSKVLYTRIKATDIISQRNFNQLFPDCIHQLFQIHTNFGEQLDDILHQYLKLEVLKNTNSPTYDERKCQTTKFGQVFLENLEKDNWNIFVVYRQYFARYKAALCTFNKLKNQSPKFDRLIKNLQHNEHCKGLDLVSYISLPIQRLHVYLTLIRQISDNLLKTQTDEKVSVLAVEHLLHCFINEMDSKLDISGNLDGTRNEYSTSRSSNISMKGTSLNEINPTEQKDKCNHCVSKYESISQEYCHKNGKKFCAEALSLNDCNNESKSRTNLVEINSESHLADIKFMNESHNTSKLLGLFASTQSLNNINKVSETSALSRKLKSPDKTNNKDSNSIYKQRSFLNSHSKIKKLFASQINNLRPNHSHLKVDVRKSLSLSTLKEYDSESLKSQVTDECSVCLNSQDEFEVDTSIEDDDKTCTGAPILKADNRDHLERHISPATASLSQNSAKYPLIEFCSENSNKSQTCLLPPTNNVHRNSVQHLSTDYKQISLFKLVLSDEADQIIYKKVDKMVKLLCHVVIEILFNDQEQSWSVSTADSKQHRSNALSSLLNKHYSAWPESMNEKSVMNSIGLSSDNKSCNKRFSLKHLFSIRRRGNDQNQRITQPIKTNESNPQIRSSLRILSQKKNSQIPKVINK